MSVSRTSEICPLCSGPGRFFYADAGRDWQYHQCGNCELIWMDSKDWPSREAERAHYGTHQNNPNDPAYRSFLNRLWEPLKAKLTPGAAGLDYGSGPGPTLHLMAQEDGFDCTHHDPFFHPDPSVFEKKYDFITCSETAEHFHDPAKEFQRLVKLLRPSGILGAMTSLHDSETDFANWHYRHDPTHVVFYSKRTFEIIADVFEFSGVEFCGTSILLMKS